MNQLVELIGYAGGIQQGTNTVNMNVDIASTSQVLPENQQQQ